MILIPESFVSSSIFTPYKACACSICALLSANPGIYYIPGSDAEELKLDYRIVCTNDINCLSYHKI